MEKIKLVYDRCNDPKLIDGQPINGYPAIIDIDSTKFSGLEYQNHIQYDYPVIFDDLRKCHKFSMDYVIQGKVSPPFVYLVSPSGHINRMISTNMKGILSDNFIRHFRRNNILLVIDCSIEKVPYRDAWKSLHDCIVSIGGRSSNVVVICGNPTSVKYYEKYVEDFSIEDKFDILIYNCHRKLLHHEYSDIVTNPEKITQKIQISDKIIRKKYFVSYNRRPRKHRIQLANKMCENSLLEKGYFSFPPVGGSNNIPFEDQPSIELLSKLPSYIDHDNIDDLPSISAAFTYSWPYRNSYFSIITETEFSNGHSLFFSESIFKPIAQYHPFICVGDPGSLKELHRLGYKTFHPHIDESYDEILDPEARMNAIFEQIKRLCNMSIHEIHDWYFNMFDIIEYNRDHFFDDKDDQLDILYDHIIDKLNKIRCNYNAR